MRITFPELQSLISEVRRRLIEHPANLASLKSALENLLDFLTAPSGNTDKYCEETDLYFCLHDEDGFNWEHLPEEFQLILDDMGGQLHDPVKHPEIASNFESTPEQLLERVREINVRSG